MFAASMSFPLFEFLLRFDIFVNCLAISKPPQKNLVRGSPVRIIAFTWSLDTKSWMVACKSDIKSSWMEFAGGFDKIHIPMPFGVIRAFVYWRSLAGERCWTTLERRFWDMAELKEGEQEFEIKAKSCGLVPQKSLCIQTFLLLRVAHVVTWPCNNSFNHKTRRFFFSLY